MIDQRQYERTPVDVPVEFVQKDSREKVSGRATDISVGGMFVQTAAPAPFSSEIVVHLSLPGQRSALAIRGVVRWTRADGMGIQFGLLGARETHAITELTNKSRRRISSESR